PAWIMAADAAATRGCMFWSPTTSPMPIISPKQAVSLDGEAIMAAAVIAPATVLMIALAAAWTMPRVDIRPAATPCPAAAPTLNPALRIAPAYPAMIAGH